MPDAAAMPMPEAMPSDSGSMSEICLPASALAVSEEGGETATPEQGDPVSFTVTGTVTRVDGENVYVSPETVNGEPLPENAEPAESEPDEDDMRALAKQADDEPTY